MNVISYGKEKPVASNKTREGRAMNRRVVIRVLA
jgi:outer membrane protein OmpA-like peptidoglycan-associated protein